MMKSLFGMAAIFVAIAASLSGCGGRGTEDASSGGGVDYSKPIHAGKYTILATLADNGDHLRAKQYAETTMVKHPNVACMVGLWEYHPPMILAALKAKGKEGEIKLVGFDEHTTTLEGITDGHIHGTIAQQPYAFGYKSVEYLAAMLRGKKGVDSQDQIYIPVTVVKKANAAEFKAGVAKILSGNGSPLDDDYKSYDTSERVKIAFLTNSVNSFWDLAEHGCKVASGLLNVECRVVQPGGDSVAAQKRNMEDFVTSGYQAMAISPIDPQNQVEMINKACEEMIVICHDSDAPKTNRKFYLGTSNYLAGRKAGKLVKEAIPDGGEVMIFAGKMEVLNSQERRQGVIDELAGKPIPEDVQSPGL